LKRLILHDTGFREGSFPFKYLGVPLSPHRLLASQYSLLLQKLELAVQSWMGKHLTYAGRLELVRKIFYGMVQFWLSIFPMPSSVINQIICICRCWDIQAIKHTQIYVVRQLAYSTELLVCINQAWKQYKQQNKEEEKNSLLNSTLPSSLSLCFSLVLQFFVSLSAPLFIIKTLSFSQIWQPPFSMVRQPTMPNLAAMFDSSHA
jgi:hypothetical protein